MVIQQIISAHMRTDSYGTRRVGYICIGVVRIRPDKLLDGMVVFKIFHLALLMRSKKSVIRDNHGQPYLGMLSDL
ncbi:hypothetical protein D3C81_2239220 [compost metagenome]